MLQFKPIPGYQATPKGFRQKSDIGLLIRQWHPAILSVLIALSYTNTIPIWFGVIPQAGIIIISLLTFLGLYQAVFNYRILTKTNTQVKNPLLVIHHQLELISMIGLAGFIHFVGWPISFGLYFLSTFVTIVVHLYSLIKTSKKKY